MFDEAEMIWTITDRANGKYDKKEYSEADASVIAKDAEAWRIKDEWSNIVRRKNGNDTEESGVNYIKLGIADWLVDEEGKLCGIVRLGGVQVWDATVIQRSSGYFALLFTSSGNIDFTEKSKDPDGQWEKETRDVYTLVRKEDVPQE